MEYRFDQIEQMYADFAALQQNQLDVGNISLASEISRISVKNLILASCSISEPFLQNVVIEALSMRCNSNPVIMHVVSKKLIDRQYHSWFDWESKNVNKFLKMFGDDFYDRCSIDFKQNPNILECSRIFLSIGMERNIIIHADMFSYSVQNTPHEIIEKLRKKRDFLNWLSARLLSAD